VHCPNCNVENSDVATHCRECGHELPAAPSAADRPGSVDVSRHQEFAKKLMAISGDEDARSEGEMSEREAGTGRSEPETAGRAFPRQTQATAALRQMLPAAEWQRALTTARADLQRSIKLGFALHVGAIVLLSLVAISSIIIFFSFLLGSGNEVETAISGAIALAALISVAVLQYVPPRTQLTAPTRLAQFEAAEIFLSKSLEFWDVFFRTRQQAQTNFSAEEISRAVESLAGTTEQLLAMLNQNLGASDRNARSRSLPSLAPGQAGVVMSTARKY